MRPVPETRLMAATTSADDAWPTAPPGLGPAAGRLPALPLRRRVQPRPRVRPAALPRDRAADHRAHRPGQRSVRARGRSGRRRHGPRAHPGRQRRVGRRRRRHRRRGTERAELIVVLGLATASWRRPPRWPRSNGAPTASTASNATGPRSASTAGRPPRRGAGIPIHRAAADRGGGPFGDAVAAIYPWGGPAETVWDVLRWPVGLLLLVSRSRCSSASRHADGSPGFLALLRRRGHALSWLRSASSRPLRGSSSELR